MSLLLQRPFPHLCKVPDLITLLQGISETYDISPLLRYMLPHLVVSIISHVTGMWFCILCPETCFLRLDSLKIGTISLLISFRYLEFLLSICFCTIYLFL